MFIGMGRGFSTDSTRMSNLVLVFVRYHGSLPCLAIYAREAVKIDESEGLREHSSHLLYHDSVVYSGSGNKIFDHNINNRFEPPQNNSRTTGKQLVAMCLCTRRIFSVFCLSFTSWRMWIANANDIEHREVHDINFDGHFWFHQHFHGRKIVMVYYMCCVNLRHFLFI